MDADENAEATQSMSSPSVGNTTSGAQEPCANGQTSSNYAEGPLSGNNPPMSNALYPTGSLPDGQILHSTAEREDGVGPVNGENNTPLENKSEDDGSDHEKRFQHLVTVVQRASADFPIRRFCHSDLEESGLGEMFEEVRIDATFSRVNLADEIILFAAAEMFRSPSYESPLYGPRLASELLLRGNLKVRYTLIRLILNAMQTRNSQKILLDRSSMDHFLHGVAATLMELHGTMSRRYEAEKNDKKEKEDANENRSLSEREASAEDRKKWKMAEQSLSFVSKIFRSFFNNEEMTQLINENVITLDALMSLTRHPKVSISAMKELLKMAARNPELLSAMDKRAPLGCAPLIIINLANFCIRNKHPSWSAPRFIGDGDLKEEDIDFLIPLLVEVMKNFALHVTANSFVLEPFCQCIPELFLVEAIRKGQVGIGTILTGLLDRFPKEMSFTDDFIGKLIPLLKSGNMDLRVCATQILTKITREHPEFIAKYKDSINAIASDNN